MSNDGTHGARRKPARSGGVNQTDARGKQLLTSRREEVAGSTCQVVPPHKTADGSTVEGTKFRIRSTAALTAAAACTMAAGRQPSTESASGRKPVSGRQTLTNHFRRDLWHSLARPNRGLETRSSARGPHWPIAPRESKARSADMAAMVLGSTQRTAARAAMWRMSLTSHRAFRLGTSAARLNLTVR